MMRIAHPSGLGRSAGLAAEAGGHLCCVGVGVDCIELLESHVFHLLISAVGWIAGCTATPWVGIELPGPGGRGSGEDGPDCSWRWPRPGDSGGLQDRRAAEELGRHLAAGSCTESTAIPLARAPQGGGSSSRRRHLHWHIQVGQRGLSSVKGVAPSQILT